MSEESPLEALEEQRRYNSKKSKVYKKLYYTFGILSIVLSSATTLVLIISDINPLIPGIISAISAILLSVSQFVGFQKHWISFRFMTETLKNEKRKFLYEIDEYDGKNQNEKEKLLAKHLISIVEHGNETWENIILQAEDDKK